MIDPHLGDAAWDKARKLLMDLARKKLLLYLI